MSVRHCETRVRSARPAARAGTAHIALAFLSYDGRQMNAPMLPDRQHLTVCFAHAAYRLGDRFAPRDSGIRFFELRTLDALEARIGEADVLVVSGLWRNGLLDRAEKLRFIQSISAGTDQYARDVLRARGIR